MPSAVRSRQVEALVLIAIALLAAYTELAAIQAEISGRLDFYNFNGRITSFTPQDLAIAGIIEKQESASHTILVSDPMTLLVMKITGLPFYQARIGIDENNPLLTSLIYAWAEPQQKEIIRDFSYFEVENLANLYQTFFNVQLNNLTVLLIVNGRTSAWVKGNEGTNLVSYSVFPGMNKLVTTRALQLLYNNSDNFLFKFRWDALVKGQGPSVLVTSGQNAHLQPTTFQFIDPHDANFTVALSGETAYDVTNFPISLSFQDMMVNGAEMRPTALDANYYVNVSGLRITDSVTLLFTADLNVTDITWKDDSFRLGWRVDGLTRQGENYANVTDGSVVTLKVGPGLEFDTMSIYKTVVIQTIQNTILRIKFEGDSEAFIRVQVVVNSTISEWLTTWTRASSDWTIQDLPLPLGNITSLKMFCATGDGSSTYAKIDYLIVYHG